MDLASLRAQQIELASSVIREDRLDKDPPDLIAGADVGFEQGGEVTRAAMDLASSPSWRRQPFWLIGGCADHWRGEKTALR